MTDNSYFSKFNKMCVKYEKLWSKYCKLHEELTKLRAENAARSHKINRGGRILK